MMLANLALSIVMTEAFGVSGVVWGSVIAMALCVFAPTAVYILRLLNRQLALPADAPESQYREGQSQRHATNSSNLSTHTEPRISASDPIRRVMLPGCWTCTHDRPSAVSVRRVTHERWLEAQRWELALWTEWRNGRGWRRPLRRGRAPAARVPGSDRGAGDDWNSWWSKQFDYYRFLPEDLGEYVELGCGPYTNTRLILRGRSANRIVCSDPLASHYLGFRGRWLADAHRRGAIEVDDHPIETLPFSREVSTSSSS